MNNNESLDDNETNKEPSNKQVESIKNDSKENEKMVKKEGSDGEKKWQFCPACGEKIPDIERIRYCVNCGLDLILLKDHKIIPEHKISPRYQASPGNQGYGQMYYPAFRPAIEKIPDDKIGKIKDRKLWSTLASLGIPLLAFVAMNGLLIVVMVIMIFLIPNYDLVYTITTSDYFIVISTLVELLLIIFPIFYVKKYLQRPTFKNRFELLGFTRKSFDNKQVVKEVLIGLAFAGVGLVIVAFSSVAIEIALEFLFNIEIIQGSESPVGDAEILVSSADILTLILLVMVMILIVGPSEEILFRGFMQRGLIRSLGDKAGLLITAFIFAIIHLLTLFIYIFEPFTFLIYFLMMFVPYFCISLMLGLMYNWRNENLIAVIVTHGVYNSLSLIIAFLFVAG